MKPSLTIGHALREPDDRSGFFARFAYFSTGCGGFLITIGGGRSDFVEPP